MVTPLTLIIDADDLAPDHLGLIVVEFTELLKALDQAVSPSGNTSLRWRVTSLSYNSPAAIEMIGSPRVGAPDVGPAVVTNYVVGVQMLSDQAVRPRGFTDDALDALRRLSAFTGNGVVQLRVLSPIIDAGEPAVVDRRVTTNVDHIIARSVTLGSIEGRAEAMNLHQQPFFTVWDSVTGRAVRCYFDEEDRERVGDYVTERRLVLVHGMVRRDPDGIPRQIRPVVEVRSLDEPLGRPVPSPVGLFVGIGNTQEYLEMLRDDA